MTSNKLADTFLNDLENLSDNDSIEEEPIIPTKLDFFGKKKQENIKPTKKPSLMTDINFIKFMKEINEEINKPQQIVPSNLTKNDRLYLVYYLGIIL